MNWFGRKTNTGKQPSAVSSTSNHTSGGGGGAAASRTTTANTVVTLRESIATQEKRWVWNIYTYFLPYYVYEGEGGNIYLHNIMVTVHKTKISHICYLLPSIDNM